MHQGTGRTGSKRFAVAQKARHSKRRRRSSTWPPRPTCSSSSIFFAGERRFWRAANLERQYKLFINALPLSMRDPSFQGKYLIDLFEGTDLAPEQIVFEVTERLAIENYALFVDAMQYFSDMRCLIAIDDMGAGYSGLEKIVHLRPNYVKLDMQLVRDIDTSFVKQQMLHAFRVMAEKIDARLIAEGVETREELETVREIGVDYVQGFLLARPSAAFQLTADIKL